MHDDGISAPTFRHVPGLCAVAAPPVPESIKAKGTLLPPAVTLNPAQKVPVTGCSEWPGPVI